VCHKAREVIKQKGHHLLLPKAADLRRDNRDLSLTPAKIGNTRHL